MFLGRNENGRESPSAGGCKKDHYRLEIVTFTANDFDYK